MEKWFRAGQSTNFGQDSRIFFSATHLKMIDLPIYKCESCGKSFFEVGILRMQIHKVHDGHKDRKCESCGKTFTGKLYLRKHIHTIHESNKDYKCESCGKSFSLSRILKRYVHTFHKGQKDYKCEICEIIFLYRKFKETCPYCS